MDRGLADQPTIAICQDEAVCRSRLRARCIGDLAAQLCATPRPPVWRAILRQLRLVRARLEDGGYVGLGQRLEGDGHGVFSPLLPRIDYTSLRSMLLISL